MSYGNLYSGIENEQCTIRLPRWNLNIHQMPYNL